MLRVRRLAAAAAGILVGLLVGEVWRRGFTAVLAALNSEEHRTRTDDGSATGQFTLSGSLNLAVVTIVIDAIGGLVFLEPLALAVAFTLSVPLLHAVGLSWLADRWLGNGPTFWRRLPRPVLHVARAGLTVVAAVSAVDLVRTVLDVLDGNQFT